MAYQIAFDMYESATQQFLGRVLQALRISAPIPSAAHVVVKVPVEGAPPVPVTAAAMDEGGIPAEPVRDIESLVNVNYIYWINYTVL